MTFVVFLIVVALYVTFLLWCLLPLIRRPKRRWLGRLRVALAVFLLCANIVPLLAVPFVGPFSYVSMGAVHYVMTVMLFPRTLPVFVTNIGARETATATVVEITYPIEIAGVRYEAAVRSACSSRRMLLLRLGDAVRTIDAEAVSGREFIGLAGDAIVAISQPARQLCLFARGGELKQFDTFEPWVFVLRGAADQTQVYRFFGQQGDAAADDIVVDRSRIARLPPMPARKVMSLDSLWPMERSAEGSAGYPPSIRPYYQLQGDPSGCVQLIAVGQAVHRTDRKRLEQIPKAQRNGWCRRVLEGLPRPSGPRIPPVG